MFFGSIPCIIELEEHYFITKHTSNTKVKSFCDKLNSTETPISVFLQEKNGPQISQNQKCQTLSKEKKLTSLTVVIPSAVYKVSAH